MAKNTTAEKRKPKPAAGDTPRAHGMVVKVSRKVLRMPGKHKGNIPAAVIRAAVKKVVAERRRLEAEAVAAKG